MNKVELAKMIGLKLDKDNTPVDLSHLIQCIKMHYVKVEWNFCGRKVYARVDKQDFTKDKLDIKLSDLEREEDIKVCIKQVEDLLWERAADKYLKMVHNAAMMIGGK